MDVLMPQLGETVAEGKITKWFKAAGDAVKPGDNLFEIETDKTSMEVPATSAGVLTEIHVPGRRGGEGRRGGRGDQRRGRSARPREARTRRAAAAVAPAQAAIQGQRVGPALAGTNARMLASSHPARWTRSSRCARRSGISVRPSSRAATFVTPLARRLAGERGIDLSRARRLGPAWPHRRGRRRSGDRERRGARGRRCDGGGRVARAGEGALSGRRLRGSAARRHAQDHRRAADRGQADHPAFLSRRWTSSSTRCSSCARRRTPARRRKDGAAGLQALGQRLRHQGAGARACSACRRRTRCGPATASCASSIPTSASRSRSTAA